MAYINYIKNEAKELYEKALALYKKSSNGLSFSQILNDLLKPYNKTVGDKIRDEILLTTATGISAGAITSAGMMTTPTLSKALYKNARQAARTTKAVMDEHLKNQSTIAEIREVLYDGYGYDELLKFKKTLPKYLQDPLARYQVDRLRTKALKTAYINMLNATNDKEFEKALKVALEEKARYYALRIANTEEARGYNIANAQRMINQGVEFVKWTLSSLHRTPCRCDFFATQNVGYGEGVYPLMDAPMPVTSSHPNCFCVLRTVHVPPDKVRAGANPSTTTLNRFSAYQQRQILGSAANVQAWQAGAPVNSILNRGRPAQYHVTTVGQIFY